MNQAQNFMGREGRKVGGMCFYTDQLPAQLINPGDSTNQKGEYNSEYDKYP